MDEQELIRMIDTRARKTARRGWKCPSDSHAASYLEQGLEPKEKSRFEAHLADCDFCLEMVGALVRRQRASESAEVPARLLQQAINAVPVRAGWRVSRKWILAPALASIAVASAVLLRSPERGKFVASVSAPPVETVRPAAVIPRAPAQPAEKQYVRKLATSDLRLQLLEPLSESVVPRARLRFRWRAFANTTYYEIRVVNSEGDLVWQGQEANPSAYLPPDLSLRPGKYFVWVRAYLTDGRTVKSEAMGFWIGSSG
jgi:hypothetical protein